jgi:GAF domain-containing protein
MADVSAKQEEVQALQHQLAAAVDAELVARTELQKARQEIAELRRQVVPAKQLFYKDLLPSIDSLLSKERNAMAACANVSAVLYHAWNDARPKTCNWVGFYLVDTTKTDKQELVLGPFQGRVACVRIPFGRGVCGTACVKRASVIVPDVHLEANHIQCDSASESEIVVPVIRKEDGRLLGVLDVDSPHKYTWDDTDREALEQVASWVADRCAWE